MEPNIIEVANRIRALREDLDLSMQEMADATGRTMAEYAAQESGEQDLSFTFLYKCADRLGVDVIELLTGENPHLMGYSLTRKEDGLSIKRRAGFEYLHKAPAFPPQACRAPSSSRRLISPRSRISPSTFRTIRVRSSITSSRARCASPTRTMSRSSRRVTCLCTIRDAATV